MNRILSILLIASTFGCETSKLPADTGADAADGSAEPSAALSFEGQDDVAVALASITLPAEAIMTVGMIAWFDNDDVGCPTVSTEDAVETWAGGCEGSEGLVWSGSMVSDETAGSTATITFTNFGFTGPDGGGGWLLDGTVTCDMSDMGGQMSCIDLAGDLQVTMLGEMDLFGSEAGQSVVRIEGYAADDLFVLMGAEGDANVSGHVVIDDSADFDMSSSFQVDPDCTDEYSGGSATFEGANTLTATFDGDASCDSCVPYTTSDGQSGQVCY